MKWQRLMAAAMVAGLANAFVSAAQIGDKAGAQTEKQFVSDKFK
jgi:hypothetical protein